MSCKITHINFYKDINLIEIIVVCNKCDNINIHTVTHSLNIRENGNKIVLNFDFGNRACDNIKCDNNYAIY